MAKSYQYHQIEEFPVLPEKGAEWQSDTQLALLAGEDDTAHSIVRFLGESDSKYFYRYFVKHETLQKRKIRFANEERSQVIFIEEFHLYIPEPLNYLWAETKAPYCNELLKRIKTNSPGFLYYNRIVDLHEMRSKLRGNVRGGWFRELEIADVSTAAIFGANVSESEEWQHYEDAGILSALVLEFTYRGGKHSVQITRNGTITLYGTYQERDSLELVDTINDIVNKFADDIPASTKKSRGDSKKIE
jgi:hypothetical protein